MPLNFGLLQPVDIGARFTAGQESVQRNQLAQQQMAASQQQLQTSAMQQEKAQMELAGFKRRQAGLDQFLIESAKRKKTGSPEEQADSFYKYSLTQEDPQLIMAAETLVQAARERSAYEASRQPPKMSPVAPVSGALGSGTFGMDQNTLGSGAFDFGQQSAPVLQPNVPGTAVSTPVRPMATPAAPMVNQLAPPPAPAAPVNQLGVDTTAIENRINELRNLYPKVPQAQKEADRLEKQLDEANKLYTVDGNLVTATGKSVFTASKKENAPPAMVAEYTFAKTPEGGGFTGSYQQFVTARAAAGRAPAQPAPLQPPVAVIGPDGKEIYVTREEALTNRMSPAGKSALTESQGNAAMFGSAMAQAQQVLNQAEKEGTTTGAGTVNLAQGIVKYVPLGVGDKLVNDIYALAVNDPTKLFGPDVNQQKVGQAQLAFAIAYLRKTSGAAFGPSEVANTIMEYFPSVGEDKAVVKQKAESRKRAIAGMKMGAGREGAKFIEQYESPSGGTSGSGANKNVITDPKFPGFSVGKP